MNTYYDVTKTKGVPNGSPAHLITAYLSSKNQIGSRALFDLLKQQGVVSGEYNPKNSKVAQQALLSLNSNPTLAKKVLSSIGLGTTAQQNAFKQVQTTPGSGVTAAMRANNPTEANARYAAIDAGNKVPTGNYQSPEAQAELQKILGNPNLSADQKAVIQSIYGAVASGDADTAARVKSAMQAATEFSDPYFKAQVRLATDALDRGISSREGDLAFSENQLKSALSDLTANTSASKDQLSFEHAQELQNLATKYQTDLQNTQDNLAATGFTSSSKRARAEQLLSDENQGLVESSNKSYGYQVGGLDRTLTSKSDSTALQLQNLQRLAAEDKLNLLRDTESKVGSSTLSDLGYDTLGGVGGTIPRAQAQDAFQFASNFVF